MSHHRYFMRLAYRGASFHGWQTQPNATSVQSTIEDAISTITRCPVNITGAGRTDAGVNARLMVAHFDMPQPLDHVDRIVRSLNSIVGPDIAIHTITEVSPDAHARFDATARTYKYFSSSIKSPFFYPLSWKEPVGLDFDLMNTAAQMLTQVSDFTSFAKLHTDTKTNFCDVSYARWDEIPGIGHVFEITADRFLRNMVRAVVGTLIEVGRGKMTVNEFQQVIEAKDRCAAGTSMPPQALFLWDIQYPYPF